MTHLYVLNTREYKEKKEDNPLASGDYPLAFFKEKARGERGERARLTLLEGELLSFAVRDSFGEKYLTKTIEKMNFGKLKFANSEKNIEFSISPFSVSYSPEKSFAEESSSFAREYAASPSPLIFKIASSAVQRV